ncbi:MAG TPA: M48 family metalloprotease, partial [Pyrinomonadaceae bacterium]|nr:M48 family metalloprotease [Pyrinomonadaceae bacterium]
MRLKIHNYLLVTALVWTLGVLPIASLAQQTRIVAPKNKYKLSDDIRLGNQAAAEAERQYPVLNDAITTQYVESVGERLVAAIPPEFQHPEFNFRFKVVNANDINAFALPGGPMYVNRGMIQAARNEGEMAGVMAHEISHVALRHATAQATKQGSAGHQLGMLGMILGGAVLGGQAGAELGAVGAQAWMTKYSREYESQADMLGAEIMANAGYDPHDLANVFRTIEQQGGSRGPQWLSDHPNPGNRYDAINREAEYLKVSSNPIKLTRDFERVKSRLAGMPPARSMAQIQTEYERTGGRGGGYGGQTPTAGGRYSRNVEYPSSRTRTYTGGNWVSLRIPDNWQDFTTSSQVTFAPSGAYGEQGITHGAMIGISTSNNRDTYQATQDYLSNLLQGNSYLRQSGSLMRTSVSGLSGYTAELTGRSDITGQTEIVTVYTALMRNGDLFYLATVAPESEAADYDSAFRTMVSSLRLT